MKRPRVHEPGVWFCKCGAALNPMGNCPLADQRMPVKHAAMPASPKPKRRKAKP